LHTIELRRHQWGTLFWSGRGLQRVTLDRHDTWTLYFTGRARCRARLLAGWAVAGVMGLSWRTDAGSTVRLWLFRRALPAPLWRRLRVRSSLPRRIRPDGHN